MSTTSARGPLVPVPLSDDALRGLAEDHSIGAHICLVGPAGCGKSALVMQLAASLGYST